MSEFRFSDAEWRKYQQMPDQGYSHRGHLEFVVNRWLAEVKAQERKDERKRLIEVLEEYRSDLYEFADSSARNDGDPAWFIGRASEVESCVALIKGETE